jgi:hypothetical protein
MLGAQQLSEATPFQRPKYMIRDNDKKYGKRFATFARGISLNIVRTPIRAPQVNAICERFIGSLRRTCLDHLLILSEQHLWRMMKAYIEYYNQYRPHQGLDPCIPCIRGVSAVDKIGTCYCTNCPRRSASPLFTGCGVVGQFQAQILERMYNESSTTATNKNVGRNHSLPQRLGQHQ